MSIMFFAGVLIMVVPTVSFGLFNDNFNFSVGMLTLLFVICFCCIIIGAAMVLNSVPLPVN